MAATPNPKDIKEAQEALDNYNDKLRESTNLARIISDNIAMLAGGMNKVSEKGRKIVSDLNDYSKSLAKTINISDKLASGKLKEKEVTDQISSLQKKYNKYLDDSNKRGSYIKENLKAQRQLQAEIANKENEALIRNGKIAQQYQKFNQQQADLAQATSDFYNANNVQVKQRAAQRMKDIREEIKDTNTTLNFLEKQQTAEEKILNTKKQELDKVETITKAHKDLKKQYEKEIKDNEAILNALKQQNSLTNAITTIYGKIKDKITDSLKPVALITSGFEYFKKIALEASDNVTKLQKGLVLSREEAYNVRQEFNNIAVASEDVAVNTTRLVEANAQLGKQLGFNSKFTADMNIQFVKLTKQIGLSEEAAGGLAKLSRATGTTLKESKNIALGTSQALSAQYGIQLDQREVLEEVGKISGQTLAMFKGSVPALAQAVAQAKLLGTSLETTKKQASALLNFESSIENELQAELLTGQQLNLERARTAALVGDMTTVMKELNNQNIDFNKFSNMNVIAQEKVATALGLSSDELSDQLFKQQYLGRSVEEVAALEGEEVAKRLEALNAQDKFNLAMEKMQDIVAKIVGGGLGQLADLMANIASNTGVLFGVLTAIAGISLAKTVMSLALMSAQLKQSAIAGAATSAFLNPVNLAIGVAALAATVGLLSSMFDNATETGDMFSSNGKTIVSPKEGGLFSLSDNDEFAAAPGLSDIINRPNQTVVAQDNSELINAVASLKDIMGGVRDGVNKLNNKEAKIQIGAQQVGTAQMMFNTNLA